VREIGNGGPSSRVPGPTPVLCGCVEGWFSDVSGVGGGDSEGGESVDSVGLTAKGRSIEVVEDKHEDGVQLIDHVLDMMKVGDKFVGVICGFFGILSFGR
jgi:hypothetical protein